MPGPDTYAGQHPAQHERFGIYGIPKGEECVTHLSEMGKYEIRIPKPRVLVQEYYMDPAGNNTKAIKEQENQFKHDKESDRLAMFDPRDPFPGSQSQLHGWQAN